MRLSGLKTLFLEGFWAILSLRVRVERSVWGSGFGLGLRAFGLSGFGALGFRVGLGLRARRFGEPV